MHLATIPFRCGADGQWMSTSSTRWPASSPMISIMQFEDLGFCRKGEGPDFVRQHDLTIDGSFPHNTSGGQLSVGQAGAGGAYLGPVEALRQVLGLAGPTQVKNARVGLASGFGMINYDRGLSSGAAILAGPAS